VLGFVDAVKQNNHFSQSRVDGKIVRLIGFFIFTPNASHQGLSKGARVLRSLQNTRRF